MSVDRRLLLNIDWVLLAAMLVLSAIGVAMIASAERPASTLVAVSPLTSTVWFRQVGWIGIGLVALVAAATVDYRRLADRAPLFYGVALVALVAVLLLGPVRAGTRRWLQLGPGQLQPSELAKIALALILARTLGESRKDLLDLSDIVGPGIATGLMVVLIALQPDLGTAFCLVPLFFSVTLLAGLSRRTIIVLAVASSLAGGLGWIFAKDYQRQRVYRYVARMVDPGGVDRRGADYQAWQSRIAVGSGGVWGRGYRKGGQSQLGYIPARHNDFIFSVLAEEMGFVGVAVVLCLYLVLLWRALETAHRARDRLGAFLAAGLTSVLAFQVIYNVAMIAGLVPVKGLPLPFLSYGGSSTLFAYTAIGLILNVRMRRFAN